MNALSMLQAVPASARTVPTGLSVGRRLALSFGCLGLAVAALGATTWLTGQATITQAQQLVQ